LGLSSTENTLLAFTLCGLYTRLCVLAGFSLTFIFLNDLSIF
jgi:hypothetical protein